MVKKKQTQEKTVVETPATVETEVKDKTPVATEPKDDELVMKANFTADEQPKSEDKPEDNVKEDVEPEDKPEDKPVEENHKSSTVVLTNCTQNIICIRDDHYSITIQPREMKIVKKDELLEIMKQEVVRRYFDKGILSTNMEAEEKSASDAVVPEELKGPVERHQDGSTVSASVKKFEKQGTVSINLG